MITGSVLCWGSGSNVTLNIMRYPIPNHIGFEQKLYQSVRKMSTKLLYLDIAVGSRVAVLGKNTRSLCQVGPHIQRDHLTTYVRKVSRPPPVWQIRFSSRPPVWQIKIYLIGIRQCYGSEMFIPDPVFEFCPSRLLDPHQRI
jgi:hypothetical protein